jgi:hypothetical protein
MEKQKNLKLEIESIEKDIQKIDKLIKDGEPKVKRPSIFLSEDEIF